MSESPLLIGVSPRIVRTLPPEFGFHDKSLQCIEQSVAHWVLSQGALPLLLPTAPARGPEAAQAQARVFAQTMDGLILQGGQDIHPARYGETPQHIVGQMDEVRDEYELALIQAFVDLGKPVLGICRGMQLINVAFGGSLYQDLMAQRQAEAPHVVRGLYDDHAHPVELLQDGIFAQWYDPAASFTVNSIHHQAVARLGEGLEAAVRAPDGVVEAIWKARGSFVLGVQWHPEFVSQDDPQRLPSTPLLQAFLDAVRFSHDGIPHSAT